MGSANGVEQAGGVDLYVGGVEQTGPHLRYARFWHKILFDVGHVSTPAPRSCGKSWGTARRSMTPPLWCRPRSCYPVTVNGKPRSEITVDQQASHSEVTDAGLALEAVVKLVEGKEIIRVVVVPGKIVNFVVRSAPREERY